MVIIRNSLLEFAALYSYALTEPSGFVLLNSAEGRANRLSYVCLVQVLQIPIIGIANFIYYTMISSHLDYRISAA